MTILGPRALFDIAVPTGVDVDALMRFEMQEGMNGQEIITFAADELGTENESLQTQYGGLWSFTQRAYARYRQGDGTRSMTPKRVEFEQPMGVRSQNIGHMLWLDDYEDATEWERGYLRRAVREDIRDDVRLIRERWRNRIDFDIITRMLTTTEIAIGSQGYAPGWAIGTGTNVNYIPPQWRGYVFDSNHTHFKRTNGAMSATTLGAMLEAAAKDLAHHGHIGTKIAWVSEADLATVDALATSDAKAAKALPSNFKTVAGNSDTPINVYDSTLQGVPGELVAVFASNYGTIEVRYHERIPAGYGFMTKSYGIGDPRNGLAVRLDSNIGGFGLMVLPQVDTSLAPTINTLRFEATHGVNVNDRTNGVAWQIEAGSDAYVNPTVI